MRTFKRLTLALATFAFVLSAQLSPAAAQGREITVEVGQQTSISASGVRNFSEGQRGIADIRLTDDQTRFVVVGQRAGSTSLLLIMQDGSQVTYNITVPGDVVDEEVTGVVERENIRLDFYFVQLSDSYSHAIGIGWPGSVGGTANFTLDFTNGGSTSPGSPTDTTSSLALVAQSVLPRLDMAQSNGWARIYRQAAVITANGTEAHFQNGGEVNIPVQGALTAEIQQIEFGTDVRIRPRYDSETGRIEVHIEAEVSDLSDDRGTGVPGRVTSNVETVVNLELGQSIVLAGLIARSENRSRAGLPGLSQIPILGALFGTHSRSYEESEALLFIVPSVVDAVPLQQRNRIQEAMRLYDDYRGGVDEVEVLEQPRVQRASE